MAKARKDIDKESMYQKIMPSSMRSVPAEEAPVEKKKPPTPRPRKSPAAVSISARPTAAAPVTRFLEDQGEDSHPAEALPAEVPGGAHAGLPPARSSVATTVAPQAAGEDKPAIVNIMERLIDQKITLAMEKFHCCDCDKCRQDITAFALNKLNPRYIVEEPDLIEEAMASKEANTQVTTALVQAILKVKANPKHS